MNITFKILVIDTTASKVIDPLHMTFLYKQGIRANVGDTFNHSNGRDYLITTVNTNMNVLVIEINCQDITAYRKNH